jgi:hypothetical protein
MFMSSSQKQNFIKNIIRVLNKGILSHNENVEKVNSWCDIIEYPAIVKYRRFFNLQDFFVRSHSKVLNKFIKNSHNNKSKKC